MTTTVLDREVYTEAGAAELLGLPVGTLHYWLEGGTRRGKTYRPIIREAPKGRKAVTWAEFIEAGLLKQYRRAHNIPMVQMREFIDRLRDGLGVPYPLAHDRPFVSGKMLVAAAQRSTKLDADFALIAMVDDQLVLTPSADAFVQRVTWIDGIAQRWRPTAEPNSKVVIDPEIRGGRPSVGGISTSAIWEQYQGDATFRELSETYDLPESHIRSAVQFELGNRAA